ncbi:methyltransferase domain-containing protein [Halobacteria archaeon AArc-dxtr1]|nr:methyltransferase domain-containing protein [Halobacteria archaeon AArc-dxtr1]
MNGRYPARGARGNCGVDRALAADPEADPVSVLDPSSGERVLDLGCGAGRNSRKIVDAGATVLGFDVSKELIEEARRTCPEGRFIRVDELSFRYEQTVDAVFSEGALHWVPESEHDAVLASMRELLAPTGRFVAEFLDAGSAANVVDAVGEACRERGYDVDAPWYLPTVGAYSTRLEAAGFEVRHASLFDRIIELEGGEDGLRNWLELFEDRLLATVPAAEREAVIADVEDRLREEWYRNGAWMTPNRRIRVIAVPTRERTQ